MHDVSVAVLSSGSCGNSILIRSDGSGIIVDAGLSCREMDRRLSLFGAESTQIEAVVLTHEHTDHTRGAKRFCIEHKIPVFATRGTIALTDLDGVDQIVIKPGKSARIGEFAIDPFKVRHLAAEPVALSVSVELQEDRHRIRSRERDAGSGQGDVRIRSDDGRGELRRGDASQRRLS